MGLVCALESGTRGSGGTGGASIGTRVRVCAVITVFAPYPGKHVNFTMSVNNVKKGEDAVINLDVTSYGTEPVTVHGVIDIYSNDMRAGKENKIITLTTQEASLSVAQNVKLNATLDTKDLETGEYRAKATLYFDDNQTSQEKIFRIGDIKINILDFTKEVSENKLNPLKIKVQSMWNAKIKEVYASVDVIDTAKNRVITTINSPPTDIAAWETKDIVAYWDTTGTEKGEYDLNITLHYEDKTTSAAGKIKVLAEGMKLSLSTILLIALIVIVIIFILVMLRMMRKMRMGAKNITKTKKKKKK
jgi:ABC-type multidrug transport system fused ATPase/permease subunit